MDFGVDFKYFRSDLKGFRPYSRDFTSDFKGSRDFTSDLRLLSRISEIFGQILRITGILG